MKTGIELIAIERATHPGKGYDHHHDIGHDNDEIAMAAVSYALPPEKREYRLAVPTKAGEEPLYKVFPNGWPWRGTDWKPTPNDRVRELVKAGALICAEIDRIQEKGELRNEQLDN